jgi:hypothetical protein
MNFYAKDDAMNSIKSRWGIMISLPVMSITAKPPVIDRFETRFNGQFYEKTTYFKDGTSKTKKVMPQTFIKNVSKELKTNNGCLQKPKNIAEFADGAVCIDGVCKNSWGEFSFGLCSNASTNKIPTTPETTALPQGNRHVLAHQQDYSHSHKNKAITTIEADTSDYAITRCIKKRGRMGLWNCEEKRVLQEPHIDEKSRICIKDMCTTISKFFAEGNVRKFRGKPYKSDVCEKNVVHSIPRGKTFVNTGTFENYGIVNTSYEDTDSFDFGKSSNSPSR